MLKLFKGIILGGFFGANLAVLDGVLFGAFFGEPLLWAAWFALGGAILGAMVGAVWALCAHRMMLPPPDERPDAS